MDRSGFFCRTFDAEVIHAARLDPAFAQDSLSRSARGVVRALHVPARGRRGQAGPLLVRCDFDVILDLRPDSPTYRNWQSFELRDVGQVSLYVPAGCAHGVQALTALAERRLRLKVNAELPYHRGVIT